ncbi:Polyketide synthase enoylreductase [Penicillium cataractarum]|uniref:Polyketide synthase enoylreductase n=1 Tax=Penicillium cataractarum TaxID=2100454 RepID=A0A9W9S3P8_9EURO|nr:Polyketide synthase enoylreductase [Penicillium cataractarum]KAJ5371421.1 Polyketide synthase enoylreductase [Penicillium cataractarum]
MSHTALRLTARDSWNSIQEFKEPRPTVGKHELLIKVRSVALNYRDIAISTSKYPFPVRDQVVPGSDAAGDVVEVGEGVITFVPGDKVVVAFDPATLYGPMKSWQTGLGGPVDGVLREYIAVPAQSVVKIPESSTLSYAQWASVVCTGVTAWNSLYGNLPLKPGQTVLFQGTGGVSITGLVLAKAAGATTIITSSSDEKLRYVKEKYQVDHVINYKKTPDWASEVQKITGGQGVDYILENGGSGTIKQSLSAIAYGGIISVIGFLSAAPQEEMPDVAGLALGKGANVRGIMIGSKQMLEDAVRFIGSHNLQLPVEKTFNFSRDEVIEALEYMTSGQHIGKICINL